MGRSIQTLIGSVSTPKDNGTLAPTAGTSVTLTDAEWALVSTSAIGRSVADGATTANSKVVTSATAAFVAGDVGKLISGGSIPAGARITAVNSGTSVNIGIWQRNELLENKIIDYRATATAAGVTLVIGVVKDNGAV